jgi:NAD(P)-dependent dehydrogenase (short-subunit alcohol dehydrogenase family)
LKSLALSGRAAIITGGNQGLGREIADRFVRAGASVLLVARGESLLAQVGAELTAVAGPDGPSVHVVSADVSNPDACARVAREAARLMPSFNILVNNAGV